MLMVKLEIDSSRLIPLREAVGTKSLLMDVPEGNTVNDMILSLDEKFGSAFKKMSGKELYDRVVTRYNIFLNNKALWLPQQLSITLKNGDEVKILLPSGGG
ncbi:MAG: MoaD/ThiS family protein [Candidatus Bathyarchaeota archaeon]|nr:MoaD/ThiS family protein [Candidatus Bathyarchaeota archaeon]